MTPGHIVIINVNLRNILKCKKENIFSKVCTRRYHIKSYHECFALKLNSTNVKLSYSKFNTYNERLLKFSTSAICCGEYKLKKEECYQLLGVTEDCNADEVRAAYIKLAKLYHPDSGSTTADARKFTQLQTAYRYVMVNI